MNKNEDMLDFSTSDIHFSSYLMANDFPLKRTEIVGQEKRKVIFVFNLPKEKLAVLKTGFFGGLGEVKAQKFVQCLRSLKSAVFVN